jgi:hypothetical protein
VAFASSPEIKAYAEYSCAKQLESSQLQKSRPCPTKTKEKADSGGWEHVVVALGGLQRTSKYNEVESGRRSGTRKGWLDSSVKEKARGIRKIKACWSCWIQKAIVRLSQQLYV